jgi:outer membrane protein W
MRKAVIFIAAVFVCSAASAQKKQTFSLFLSDVMQTQTDRVSESWPSGFGVAYERMLAPRWSVQAAVAVEHHGSYPYIVEDNGAITFVDRERLQTIPIDLTARYHWVNDTRWKPYLGFGAHYIAAPNADARFRYKSHLDAQLNGGTLFMFTPTLGAMLDARVLGGDREPYEQALKLSFGLSWRF